MKQTTKAISSSKISHSSGNEWKMGLLALPVLIILYYSIFVRSVAPLEMGWFQDIAMRMDSGEVIYRDFYWYAPPYFPWFCLLIYKLFGTHYILYTVFGLLVNRVGQGIIAYLILTKYYKPRYALLAIMLGVAVNSAYAMDLVFDTNPFITTLMMAEALLLQRLADQGSKRTPLVNFFVGVCSGIQIMMKQTGIALLAAALIITVSVYILQRRRGLARALLIQGTGVIAGILPGLMYLSANGALVPMMNCITIALGAKAGVSGSIKNMLNMIKPVDLGIAVLIAFLVKFPFSRYQSEEPKKNYIRHGVRLIIGFWIIALIIIRMSYFPTALVNRLKTVQPGILIPTIFLLITFVTLILVLVAYCSRRNNAIALITVISALMITAAVAAILVPHSLKQATMKYLSFSDLKQLTLYVSTYLLFIFWAVDFHSVVKKFNQSETSGFLSCFIYHSFVVAYMAASMLSATIEELYMLPVISIVATQILGLKEVGLPGIFLFSIYACLMITLCLFQKVLVPYSWHTWQAMPIDLEDNQVRSVNIPGLEGFLLADSEAKQYEEMYQTINKYVGSKDELFQFCNVPLMCVLTGHPSSRYVPVTYFDVCPDELATETADSLYTDMPKAIYWGSFNEDRWRIHESLFRAGRTSGQREIQRFYESTIMENYTNIGHYACGAQEGSSIDIWIRADD